MTAQPTYPDAAYQQFVRPVTDWQPGIIPDGAPNMVGRVTDKVRWSDSARLYGCRDCDYRDVSFRAVVGHRRTHTPPKPGKGTADQRAAAALYEAADTIAAVAEQIARGDFTHTIEAPPAKVDADILAEWKRRAKDAEKRLTQMRRALGAGD